MLCSCVKLSRSNLDNSAVNKVYSDMTQLLESDSHSFWSETQTHKSGGQPKQYTLQRMVICSKLSRFNLDNFRLVQTRIGNTEFATDGSLRESLQDPIGLDYTMGSIGILN